MVGHRVVVIAGLVCGLAVHAVAQPRVTWTETGIRNGEPWREVTAVEIGAEAVRAAARHGGDREPFLGVEYRRADGLLRISMPDAGPQPIEVTAAQLDEMEATARRAAPALYDHPLRRGKLFRTSSTAEVAGVPCTNFVYTVEGAPERSLCIAEPLSVPLAPEDLAALEHMSRDLSRWGLAMKVVSAERRGETVNPAEHFDVTVFDQGVVLRAWTSESGRVTWKLEMQSIEGAGN